MAVISFEGYYEDFDRTPIENEFGERHWIGRYLTEQQVREIELAKSTESLDIDSFAKQDEVPKWVRRSTFI